MQPPLHDLLLFGRFKGVLARHPYREPEYWTVYPSESHRAVFESRRNPYEAAPGNNVLFPIEPKLNLSTQAMRIFLSYGTYETKNLAPVMAMFHVSGDFLESLPQPRKIYVRSPFH